MIKPQLSLASIQEKDKEKIMLKVFARRLDKLMQEFNIYPTVIQFSKDKPKENKGWDLIGCFLALRKN